MDNLQNLFTFCVFFGVILAIAFDIIDMVLAALLGVSLLIFAGDFTIDDVLNIARMANGPIALLFGGMVVARTLMPTGIFDWVGTRFLILTRGSGKRFLLGLIILVAPLCAILPNATTVILLAPVIIRVAEALEVDFIGPMIFTAILSNSAGLLTLVGDPATFMVGSSIGMGFVDYLKKVSLGGLISILAIIPFMPWLMKDVWNVRRQLPEGLKPEPLKQPWLCIVAFSVLAVMVLLFLFGESIPHPIVPPAAAIVGATLALLVTYSYKVEPIDRVIRDVDWRTLLFLMCLFSLVAAIDKTGVLQSVSQNLHAWFGRDQVAVGMAMLAGVGVLSGFLANIPIVAVMLVMVKGYLVTAEWVPESALAPDFSDWPRPILPVFVAMMFGATLGGNATLIGASANVVSVGICANHGRQVSFMKFMRYGLPIMAGQLAVSAAYVLLLFYLSGRPA